MHSVRPSHPILFILLGVKFSYMTRHWQYQGRSLVKSVFFIYSLALTLLVDALAMRDTVVIPWWRHQTETFSVLLAICAVNSPVTGEFPAQRPVTRSFDVFFDLRLNKQLSKQSWGWWFQTPSCSFWRQCNANASFSNTCYQLMYWP